MPSVARPSAPRTSPRPTRRAVPSTSPAPCTRVSEPRWRIVSVSLERRRAAAARSRRPSAGARTASSTPSRRRAPASGRAPRARRYGPFQLPVGTLKRHGAMPSPQFENANAMSSPVRAVTKYSPAARRCRRPAALSRSGSARVDARDARRVGACPRQYVRPPQSRTSTAALATGVASSSRVTHTSDDSRPELEVHAEVGDQRRRAHVERLAARRAARRRASGSRARRRRSPASGSGMPTTSNALAPPGFGTADALRARRRG